MTRAELIERVIFDFLTETFDLTSREGGTERYVEGTIFCDALARRIDEKLREDLREGAS